MPEKQHNMTFGDTARTFCGNLGKYLFWLYICVFLVSIMSIKKITLLEMFLMNISCKRAFLAVKVHLESSFSELFQFVSLLFSSTEPENSIMRGIIGGLGI